jgi:hypothetical protein
MKTCKRCNVELDNSLTRCPLCQQPVEGESIGDRTYPLYGRRNEKGELIEDQDHKARHRKRRLQNLFIFGTILLLSVTIVVNAMTFRGEYWGVYVVSSVFYLWFSIKHTILSNNRACRKILLQAVSLSAFMAVIGVMIPDFHSLIDYGIPLVLSLAVGVEGLLLHFRKSRWKAYVRDFFVMDLLGYLPILLFAVGIIDVLWPSVVAALVSFLTLSSQFAFSFRRFKDELRRLLHH